MKDNRPGWNYWRRLCGRVVVGWGCLATGCGALAWSSQNYPLFEPVHQKAIDNVLGKMRPNGPQLVSDENLAALKNEQPAVDGDQTPSQSEEHSMTGIIRPGLDRNTERKKYIEIADRHVRSMLMQAIRARKGGYTILSFCYLGKAIHALEDSTSPVHKGFQYWTYEETWWSMARHVLAERSYPNDTGPEGYWSQLEGTVEYAYRLYTGEESQLPARFFTPFPQGKLIIPTQYLHH